jgi:nucleoside-diphosphate-sugar epimerase
MDFPHAKRVLPQMIERVFRRLPFRVSGDGSQRRTFCYHTDTIDGVLLALAAARDSPAGSHATFNIGHPQAYTIRELAERINRVAVELGLLGAPLPIELHAQLYSQPFDDAWHRAPDIRRARELLGFEPRVGLEDGLARTLMAYAPDHFQPVMLGAASA